jgi:hypothetical protein
MPIEFDPEKSRRNVGRGRMPFEEADAFEFETAILREDRRFSLSGAAVPGDRTHGSHRGVSGFHADSRRLPGDLNAQGKP